MTHNKEAEKRWLAWRQMVAAVNAVAAAYLGHPVWTRWANQLAEECREHAIRELNNMAGHNTTTYYRER